MNFIDCHNHSLPFIDDGAESMEMALDMLRVAQKNNTSDVVLTPHHLNGVFDNPASVIEKHFKLLKKETKQHNIKVTLHLGSEVHLTHETVDQLISQKALTYGGHGKAALIELPKHGIPLGAKESFQALIKHGITPIIAHPERNSTIRKDLDILKNFINLGCKSQLTAMSCTGEFGPELQSICHEMIKQGYVHLIASDAHRPSVRSPNLLKVGNYANNKYGRETSELLLYKNPQNLIDGKPLKTTEFKKKKSLFSFLS